MDIVFKNTTRRAYLRVFLAGICVSMIFSSLAGCNFRNDPQKVVVYTSVDQVYAEKLFKAFEKKTGIKVVPSYDIEATKTVGKVNQLILEKANPLADVFWNGEILQTILLKENGILSKSSPVNKKNLPAPFIDKDGMWYGFGGRARVLIFNKSLISKEDCPKTMEDFTKNANISKTGLAYPVFGTTATHAAALFSYWGAAKAKTYYQDIKKAGVVILDGNGVVKDYVGQKKLVMGLTDTDDALSEMASNKDLDILFMDQGDGQMGNLVIPNSVAKIKNGPNPGQAEIFIDYLLSAEAEQSLVDDGWIQIPVNNGVKASPLIDAANIRIMQVDFNKAYDFVEEAKNEMTSIFIR
ncbi:MAG: extracellular solute-binding protein [Saccharofermentanales bacterium]